MTVDDVLQAMEVIRELNPKPGNSFSSRENLKYITPDVTVVKLKDYYEILLNEYMYPKMSINGYYRNMLKAGNDKETKDYVTTKVKQAEWVMQCVSQRNVTLMNVSKCIVDVQERFFTYGPGYLRPLKLADVAEMVGIHESTVSRAVKDKYLQCSWGIFPMNYFFIGAISKAGNENAATADTAKNLLKEIITDENHEKPYSDRILSEKLAERGVKISRRTVAKYREAMGIRRCQWQESLLKAFTAAGSLFIFIKLLGMYCFFLFKNIHFFNNKINGQQGCCPVSAHSTGVHNTVNAHDIRQQDN